MFLQFAIPGSVAPFLSKRLTELGFTPMQVGWASATQAVAALVAPLVAGQVADRWLPAQRCVCVLGLTAAGLLWLLASLTTPLAVGAVSLLFWMVTVPAVTLGTSLSLAHLTNPEQSFGRIRLWGTVGWVVAGWLLGSWHHALVWLQGHSAWLQAVLPQVGWGDAFRLGGVFALILGLYALTLPHTPPRRLAVRLLAPLAALGLLRQRSFLVCCACTLGFYVTVPFQSQVTPLLLSHLGIPDDWLGPSLTVSQSVEILGLALLPMALLRLGNRGTMLLGLGAWLVVLTVQSLGLPVWLVVAALALNGVCVCCFMVVGQLFVNSRAQGDLRASAQGLLTWMTGAGMLTGNLLVGWVREQVDQAFTPTFAIGAVMAAVLVLAFLVGFVEEEASTPAPAASTAV
jgi:MFS family permease